MDFLGNIRGIGGAAGGGCGSNGGGCRNPGKPVKNDLLSFFTYGFSGENPHILYANI